MNEKLLEVVLHEVAQCRADGLDDSDTSWSAIGACVRYGREQGVIGDEVSSEMVAAIATVVKEVMDTEPTMEKCPYCFGSHYNIEQCPLNPNRRSL